MREDSRVQYLRKLVAVEGLVGVVRVGFYESVPGKGPGIRVGAASVQILFERRVYDRLSG